MALERRTYARSSTYYVLCGADHASTSRQVAAVSIEALGLNPGGADAGADLGGSSKYSNENFKD